MKKQRRNKLAGSTLVQVVGAVCDAAKFDSHEDVINQRFDATSRTTQRGYIMMSSPIETVTRNTVEIPCETCTDKGKLLYADNAVTVCDHCQGNPECYFDGPEDTLYELEIVSIWGENFQVTNVQTGKVISAGYWSDGKWWKAHKKGLYMANVLNQLIFDGIWSANKPEPEQDYPCMACGGNHGGRICPSVL